MTINQEAMRIRYWLMANYPELFEEALTAIDEEEEE